jgi:hypothetical protein
MPFSRTLAFFVDNFLLECSFADCIQDFGWKCEANLFLKLYCALGRFCLRSVFAPLTINNLPLVYITPHEKCSGCVALITRIDIAFK